VLVLVLVLLWLLLRRGGGTRCVVVVVVDLVDLVRVLVLVRVRHVLLGRVVVVKVEHGVRSVRRQRVRRVVWSGRRREGGCVRFAERRRCCRRVQQHRVRRRLVHQRHV
jgi:hypothetical protein